MAGVNGRRRVLSAAAAAVIFAVSGCSTVGPTVSAAADVAVQFHQAITAGDGTTACSVLAPETVHELEQTNGHSVTRPFSTRTCPMRRPCKSVRCSVTGRRS